ncbi:MAG: glycosyltransferase [Lachnospiraceae bacterium]|nr:glycosyltransferase [Lachnospiraceae bacterium]
MQDAVLDLTIIVPSYNPDEKLRMVVEGLRARGFHDIIIVNDGSDEAHQAPFEMVGSCTVIHHKVNKGKGRALKTAFAFCMENRQNSQGVITVDGDNQHHPDDVYACGRALLENRQSLVLGCRNFKSDDVPPRSKFGNGITKGIFRTLCGLKISDTQTGLRAIAMSKLSDMMEVKGERYEYETNMLLETKNMEMPICEVPIRTIYIDENESSHFNPIKDSIKIYSMILKFFMNSILSTVIDLTLYFVISLVLTRLHFAQASMVFVATIFARACSSFFNYKMNRKVVFGQGGAHSVVKYYILCACQMTVSAILVYLFTDILMASTFMSTVVKAVVDTGLFFISFRIQKNWVFRRERERIPAGGMLLNRNIKMDKDS